MLFFNNNKNNLRRDVSGHLTPKAVYKSLFTPLNVCFLTYIIYLSLSKKFISPYNFLRCFVTFPIFPRGI